MKFIYGEMPKNESYEFEEYQLLKEPQENLFHLIALSCSIVLWVAVFFIWSYLDKDLVDYSKGVDLIKLALIFILVIPFHEFIHAVFYPLTKHQNIVIGFWPKVGAFYATYTEKLSRNRWLAVYLAPFIIISILPMLFIDIYTSSWIAAASIINAGLASVDCIAATLIIMHIPRRSHMVQNGWKTYWKKTN